MTDPISLRHQLSQLSTSLKRVQEANVDLIPLGKLLPSETSPKTLAPEDTMDTVEATPVHRADDVLKAAERVQRALQAVARELDVLPDQEIHAANQAVGASVQDLHWLLQPDEELQTWGEATLSSELLGPLVTDDLLLALKHHGDEDMAKRFQHLPLAASGASRLGDPITLSEQIPTDFEAWTGSQLDAFCNVVISQLQIGRLGEKDMERLEKLPRYFKHARYEVMQGFIAYQRNEPDSARRHAERCLQRDPKTGPALELLGAIALQKKEYASALSWVVKLEAAEGTTLATLDRKANLLKLCGRLSEAGEVLRQAISLPSGNDANRRVNLAWNLLRLGTPATDPEVQGLLTEAPTEFGAQLLHAEALRRVGESAADDLLRSLVESGESAPQPPANLMGVAYFGLAHLGSPVALGQARAWMDEATRESPDLPSLHFRSGLFELAAGDAPFATASYKAGLNRQPSVEILQEALRDLAALPASQDEEIERGRVTVTQALAAALTEQLEPKPAAAEA